ncbi:hypothetical protein Acr_23g0015710 [Actinidia rufa]|uniref:Uncharacterized protein n=1 Tax=Actinidia rufa TaxID=165716 RepID=A0A7J0GQV3_9ERIC|nr:hypothetical protein Acr_23g0015710 [Actinidia rufa]
MEGIGTAFAIVDGDEWRHRLLPSISLSETSFTVLDQTIFVVPLRTLLYCQHCRKPDHLINRCFDLYPELKPQLNWNCSGGRVGGHMGGRGHGTSRVGAIVEVEPMHVELSNLNQLQTQMAQLQLHMGVAPPSSSFGPMAAIVAKSPTALHGKLGYPT